jgi:hypothetical protein
MFFSRQLFYGDVTASSPFMLPSAPQIPKGDLPDSTQTEVTPVAPPQSIDSVMKRIEPSHNATFTPWVY